MSSIFISYRRGDSSGHAGRLFDHLVQHFGRDRIFMDVAGIEPGIDFVEAIEKALGSCVAFLVVIGRDWLGSVDRKGNRRLDDPHDFVRLEIQTALERNIRVIPVLIEGASMPASAALPDVLAPLARRQPIEITDNRWDYDAGRLIEALNKVLGSPVVPPKADKRKDTLPVHDIPTPRFQPAISPGLWQVEMKVFGIQGLTMFLELDAAGQLSGHQKSLGISTAVTGTWSYNEHEHMLFLLVTTHFAGLATSQTLQIQLLRQEGELLHGKDNLMRQFAVKRLRGTNYS